MPPNADRAPAPGLFDELYASPDGPPWDIGRPQDELVWAVWNGEVLGPQILDVGCGTGDNAVLLAMHGFDVIAFDFHEAAVDVARQRVAAAGELRGSVRVLHADVFKLTDELGTTQFDSVVDSAVFHCIGNDEVQERYARILAERVRQGGHLLLHAVSDRNPDPWIGPPRRLSEERARRLFCKEAGWHIESVRHCLCFSRIGFPEGGGQAIFVVATRL
mmetsp:Transcript_48898/g.97216  ORF Transcript_48898/g.97216 Transcript_48898/m.97216 type:complete len:218 (-) Transcript_48898:16-669(-)